MLERDISKNQDSFGNYRHEWVNVFTYSQNWQGKAPHKFFENTQWVAFVYRTILYCIFYMCHAMRVILSINTNEHAISCPCCCLFVKTVYHINDSKKYKREGNISSRALAKNLELEILNLQLQNVGLFYFSRRQNDIQIPNKSILKIHAIFTLCSSALTLK